MVVNFQQSSSMQSQEYIRTRFKNSAHVLSSEIETSRGSSRYLCPNSRSRGEPS